MKILIQGGRLIDPASHLDRTGDVAIANGRIVHLGDVSDFGADRTVDARGLIVAPGLVDLCARLREPGHEHEGLLAWSARPTPTRRWTSPAWSRC
jgi:dihydroorotase